MSFSHLKAPLFCVELLKYQ